VFASDTFVEHVLRGAIGIGALWIAVAIAATHPWGSLALGGLVAAGVPRLSDLLDDRAVRNRKAAMASAAGLPSLRRMILG
jgi:hypothetical protein